MKEIDNLKKIDNLKEIEIASDINYLSEIIYKQLKKRKSNNLEKMGESITRLAYYFLESKNERRLYKDALSDYRLQKNRAIQRARKAEKEIYKLNTNGKG